MATLQEEDSTFQLPEHVIQGLTQSALLPPTPHGDLEKVRDRGGGVWQRPHWGRAVQIASLLTGHVHYLWVRFMTGLWVGFMMGLWVGFMMGLWVHDGPMYVSTH